MDSVTIFEIGLLITVVTTLAGAITFLYKINRSDQRLHRRELRILRHDHKNEIKEVRIECIQDVRINVNLLQAIGDFSKAQKINISEVLKSLNDKEDHLRKGLTEIPLDKRETPSIIKSYEEIKP